VHVIKQSDFNNLNLNIGIDITIRKPKKTLPTSAQTPTTSSKTTVKFNQTESVTSKIPIKSPTLKKMQINASMTTF